MSACISVCICMLCMYVCMGMIYLTTHSTHFIHAYMASDMVMDHSDSKRGNPLPPHRLLFSISSKGSFICTTPHTGYHIPWPLLHQSWSTGMYVCMHA